MRFIPSLLVVACVAAPLMPAHALETTAGNTLQVQTNWSALKALIDKTDGDVRIVKADVDAIRACNGQSMFYMPADPRADEHGCKSSTSGRLKIIGNTNIYFNSKTSSNAAVSSAISIPEGATKVELNTACSAKDPDAQVLGYIKFNISGPEESKTVCTISGVNDFQTNRIGFTNTVEIPDGATSMNIIRTSSGPNVKSFLASGYFLGR
jgi:hypothetical protein